MTVGVIVVAYRDPSSLIATLESLRTARRLIVVNVTADPEVSAVVEAATRTEVAIRENVGYAAAVNLAVERLPSDVDVVAFFNDDVVVCRPNPFEFGVTAGVRVPLHATVEGTWRPVLHPLPSPLQFIRHWVLARPFPRNDNDPDRVAWAANGAALVVRRSVLEHHPLPAEYFMYWEETAWFWRLRDAYVPVEIDDDFRIERPRGEDEYSTLKSRMLGRNLVRLGVERYGNRGHALYLTLGALWLTRLCLTDLFARARWQRLRSRRSALGGLVGGAIRRDGHGHDA